MLYRFIMLVLFFDLPVIKASQRKVYTRFVKDIKKLGFYMLQESVYIRMCIDPQNAESVINKVRKFSPGEGSVMILTVTEKQFAQMDILVGEVTTDIITSDERLIIL